MTKPVKWILVVVALIGAGVIGLLWGPDLLPQMERLVGPRGETPVDGIPASPELADATLDRFERFRRGGEGNRLVLGSSEVTSVVRYSLPGLLPPGLSDLGVALDEGGVRVSARAALADFPSLPDLGRVVGLLPDTVLIEFTGSLVPLDQGHLALLVDQIRVARIPLPSRMVAEVVAGLGGRRPASLPPDALAVPLPDGVGSVYVQRDSLVLRAEGGGGS